MANALGETKVKARGKEYRLHLGMSVLADLQDQFGERLQAVLSPPENVDADEPLPDLGVMHAVFLGALQRYHADEADRWLVDDIVSENQDAWARLLTATAPDAKNGGKPAKKEKAASLTSR